MGAGRGGGGVNCGGGGKGEGGRKWDAGGGRTVKEVAAPL